MEGAFLCHSEGKQIVNRRKMCYPIEKSDALLGLKSKAGVPTAPVDTKFGKERLFS